MTLILPLLMILTNFPVILGGAKPVPVDPFNLRDGRKDLALVSLAGPITNFLIAIVAAIVIHLFFPNGAAATSPFEAISYVLLMGTVRINIALAIFNLLPIPPLDGSKVFSLVLPPHIANQYLALGNIGPIILLVLLLIPIGGFSIFDIIRTLSCSILDMLKLPC